MSIPEGWTDDMSIDARHNGDVSKIVATVLAWFHEDVGYESAVELLQVSFGLSLDDAFLTMDRVPGGVIRAITGNPANRPNPKKDPLAYTAFNAVWDELPRRHWFSRHRIPQGRWLSWFERRQAEFNQGESGPGE
jgi:hypothetical protein